MRIRLGKEDLQAGETIKQPGWKACEITQYKEEAAKTDGSTNAVINLRIIHGEDKGLRSMIRFNEKALGFAKNFLKALGAQVNAEGGLDAELTPALVGKKIDVYMVVESSNKGNKFNSAQDYAPFGTHSGAVAEKAVTA